jgi:deoxyribonuclease-4
MVLKMGPAGLGGVKTAEKVLEDYHSKGFKACEIAFTYSAYIKNEEDAIRIGKRAKELGIDLSIHASYFVNLNSDDKEKIKASKERILECCRVGEQLGVKVVVFHPGYYGNKVPKSSLDKLGQASDYGKKGTREEAYENIKKNVLDIMKEIKKKKWKIEIAPETMGKINVFGSVEEISKLVKETGCSFCIDFAHILARDKEVDFAKIKKLFPQKKWHCHFSGIVFGEKGEKRHKTTTKTEWTNLFANLSKDKAITIINESPTMIKDCLEGLKISKKFF